MQYLKVYIFELYEQKSMTWIIIQSSLLCPFVSRLWPFLLLLQEPQCTALHTTRGLNKSAEAGWRDIPQIALTSWTPGMHGDGNFRQ